MTIAGKKSYAIKNCSVIILAAGQSSRLGKPKQLLRYQNKTLLQHVIDTAKRSLAQSVIVVLGCGIDAILNVTDTTGLYVAKNEDWQSGMASTIRCGITALQNEDPTADAAILMVCDQPFVTAGLLNSLIEKQNETSRPIVASKYNDTLGTPALFHERFFPQLTDLKGDTGAKKIMMQNADLLASVPFLNGGIDIDTLDDYEALKK
ncbi:MAG TPA: nucleotidyltransferase family protein [Mucilaginibacter sp.]|jgi:molybdenum cofactor cytidylyltransferase|nr:nucleotidyltransferase family protein [Mucilaginibacter sp.]